MIDQQHPITPPPELILEWCRGWNCTAELTALKEVATQAARWGADQELEACCKWVSAISGKYGPRLRIARRPKPPSLKEQALQHLDSLHADLKMHGFGTNTDTIRRALETLDD